MSGTAVVAVAVTGTGAEAAAWFHRFVDALRNGGRCRRRSSNSSRYRSSSERLLLEVLQKQVVAPGQRHDLHLLGEGV